MRDRAYYKNQDFYISKIINPNKARDSASEVNFISFDSRTRDLVVLYKLMKAQTKGPELLR